MKFTKLFLLLPLICAAFSCNTKSDSPNIEGTWELISATTTEKDSTFSTFDPTRKMVKIINPTHFAFLEPCHLRMEKDTTASSFYAGGGAYTLMDSVYTEKLEFFADPAWENHSFEFVVKIQNDTLIQKGTEKVEGLGIDRVITEKYKRLKTK